MTNIEILQIIEEIQYLYDIAIEPKNQGKHSCANYAHFHQGSMNLKRLIAQLKEQQKTPPPTTQSSTGELL